MKKPLLLLLLLTIVSGVFAQTVTFTGTGNLLIPPGAPGSTVGITQSPCVVAGVGIIGGCVSIDNVTIDLTHTWVGDIGILLIGPGGQILDLSTGNGGAGDNYNNTVFTDNTASFITTGTPPYNGVFRPEGRAVTLPSPYSNAAPLGTHTFANTYNGTNADGVWTLYINDYVPGDIGLLISWSITFNIGGIPPVADAGPDVTICTGSSTTLTATGGGTYAWSNSATTATTTVTPPSTTTYTVTVSQPGCGTDTDEVVVTVEPAVVSLVASPTTICTGQSSTLTAVSVLSGYAWSNGLTGASISVNMAGTYTVTATDANGCSATSSVSIGAQPLPTVSFSVAGNNVCAGECPSITVNLTGVAPFSLSGEVQVGGSAVGTFNQVIAGLTGSFSVCIPPGTPPGPVTIRATSLSDTFCTCN